MTSLRAKLLVFLLAVMAAVWAVTAALVYFDAHHEIDELYDAQLAQSAKVLLAQAAHDLKDARESDDGISDDGIAEEIASIGHKYERKIAFQVWGDHDRLLLRSASAPIKPLAAMRDGYAEALIGGEHWRVYTQMGEDGGIWVQVGEQHEIRDELAASVAQRLLIPMGVALPILSVLIWIGVGKGLSPLRRIGNEVAQRDPANLSPLEESAVPSEISPLLHAINALLARLGGALENERRFTADAAHELRTPLAALKTQAQIALRAKDEAQRRNALEKQLLGVDRATHLVEQLLTLARLDPTAAPAAREPYDLGELARRTLADLASSAVAKDIELELIGVESVPMVGYPGMLGILLRNLVDNAIRYTPPGGRVQVSLDTARLEVTDSGPGISDEERQRVFDRFYRVLGNDAPGSGLGLSIVKRIADLHGAEIGLDAGAMGKGLKVTVSFPNP